MDAPLDVIFAMPHPDDLEIMCGGTIARLVKLGYRVGMLHLTDGEPTPLGTREVRAAECRRASEILGVAWAYTLGLPNRVLMDCPENRYKVATIFRRHKPKVVVSMHGRTPAASPDHYQAQLLIEASRFYSQLTKWDDRFENTAPHRIDWLWYRPAASSADITHWPGEFVVDVSDVWEVKKAAISAYASQFPPERLERLLHRVAAIDAVEGGKCGFRYGELFGLPHPVPMPDPLGHFQSFKAPPGPPAIGPMLG
jgi:LmbE family N-acetylglucosaminyl deacetylase